MWTQIQTTKYSLSQVIDDKAQKTKCSLDQRSCCPSCSTAHKFVCCVTQRLVNPQATRNMSPRDLIFPLGFFLLFTPTSFALKCFTCEFNIALCKTPNCYHNPDICSPIQFSQVIVPIQECPHNCMLKAVTNPAGKYPKNPKT